MKKSYKYKNKKQDNILTLNDNIFKEELEYNIISPYFILHDDSLRKYKNNSNIYCTLKNKNSIENTRTSKNINKKKNYLSEKFKFANDGNSTSDNSTKYNLLYFNYSLNCEYKRKDSTIKELNCNSNGDKRKNEYRKRNKILFKLSNNKFERKKKNTNMLLNSKSTNKNLIMGNKKQDLKKTNFIKLLRNSSKKFLNSAEKVKIFKNFFSKIRKKDTCLIEDQHFLETNKTKNMWSSMNNNNTTFSKKKETKKEKKKMANNGLLINSSFFLNAKLYELEQCKRRNIYNRVNFKYNKKIKDHECIIKSYDIKKEKKEFNLNGCAPDNKKDTFRMKEVKNKRTKKNWILHNSKILKDKKEYYGIVNEGKNYVKMNDFIFLNSFKGKSWKPEKLKKLNKKKRSNCNKSYIQKFKNDKIDFNGRIMEYRSLDALKGSSWSNRISEEIKMEHTDKEKQFNNMENNNKDTNMNYNINKKSLIVDKQNKTVIMEREQVLKKDRDNIENISNRGKHKVDQKIMIYEGNKEDSKEEKKNGEEGNKAIEKCDNNDDNENKNESKREKNENRKKENNNENRDNNRDEIYKKNNERKNMDNKDNSEKDNDKERENEKINDKKNRDIKENNEKDKKKKEDSKKENEKNKKENKNMQKKYKDNKERTRNYKNIIKNIEKDKKLIKNNNSDNSMNRSYYEYNSDLIFEEADDKVNEKKESSFKSNCNNYKKKDKNEINKKRNDSEFIEINKMVINSYDEKNEEKNIKEKNVLFEKHRLKIKNFINKTKIFNLSKEEKDNLKNKKVIKNKGIYIDKKEGLDKSVSLHNFMDLNNIYKKNTENNKNRNAYYSNNSYKNLNKRYVRSVSIEKLTNISEIKSKKGENKNIERNKIKKKNKSFFTDEERTKDNTSIISNKEIVERDLNQTHECHEHNLNEINDNIKEGKNLPKIMNILENNKNNLTNLKNLDNANNFKDINNISYINNSIDKSNLLYKNNRNANNSNKCDNIKDENIDSNETSCIKKKINIVDFITNISKENSYNNYYKKKNNKFEKKRNTKEIKKKLFHSYLKKFRSFIFFENKKNPNNFFHNNEDESNTKIRRKFHLKKKKKIIKLKRLSLLNIYDANLLNNKKKGENLLNINSANYNSNKFLLGKQKEKDKGKKTVVLDLDETLVHSTLKRENDNSFKVDIDLENNQYFIYVNKRPGAEEFLKEISKYYEVVIFTASLSKYANAVIDKLDINNVCAYRLFRESCSYWKNNYVKDVKKLGRDLRNVVIIDNSVYVKKFCEDNCILIDSWFDDPNDKELYKLIPFLKKLSKKTSVIPELRKYHKKKIKKNRIR